MLRFKHGEKRPGHHVIVLWSLRMHAADVKSTGRPVEIFSSGNDDACSTERTRGTPLSLQKKKLAKNVEAQNTQADDSPRGFDPNRTVNWKPCLKLLLCS